MSVAYIPPKDADLALWADNFADLITAAPATYGLVAGDALTIQTANDIFQADYLLAVNPGTRTSVTIAQKNSTKLAFVILARTYASQIRINPGVSNADKILLGLTDRKFDSKRPGVRGFGGEGFTKRWPASRTDAQWQAKDVILPELLVFALRSVGHRRAEPAEGDDRQESGPGRRAAAFDGGSRALGGEVHHLIRRGAAQNAVRLLRQLARQQQRFHDHLRRQLRRCDARTATQY